LHGQIVKEQYRFGTAVPSRCGA